ncbi:unnamed protein product, partial [Rotaria sp. Silwood2]
MQTGMSPVIRDKDGTFNSGYSQHTGAACFAGGYGLTGAPSRLLQNVNLSDGSRGFSTIDIDNGRLVAEVSFYYQNWYNFWVATDAVKVSIAFRSAANTALATRTTGSLICTAWSP